MRWFLFLLITITFAASAFAAENGDCEARLGTHSITRNILGVITTSLRNGGMTMEAVRILAESESPVNPLARMTPTSINAAARRALTVLVSDPRALPTWPETRKRLQALLAKHSEDAQVVNVAREQTRRIIAPHVVSEISYTQNTLHLTTMEDGTAIAVHLVEGKELVVTRIADDKVIFRTPFTDAFKYYFFGRLVDENGHAELFLGCAQNRVTQSKFFKFNLAKLDFKPIEFNSFMGIPLRFFEVRPDVLLAEIREIGHSEYLRVRSNTLEKFDVKKETDHDFTEDGRIRTGSVLNDDEDRYFRISGNRRVHTFFNGLQREIAVQVEGSPIQKLNIQNSPGGALGTGREVALVELRDGRLILALAQQAPNRELVLSMYDLNDGPNPYFIKTYKGQSLYDLQWFSDELGDGHLAATILGDRFSIIFVDPISRYGSEPLDLGVNSPSKLLDAGKDKYFFVSGPGGTAKIYSVFGVPRPTDH